MLLTVREPISQMESLYLQELKSYNIHPERNPRLIKRFGAPPRFFSAEEWLDANWSFPNHGLFSHLNVGETAESYADVVGNDNVLIQIYEEMKKDNIGYIRHLSHVIGIDSDESQQLCDNQDTAKNSRWNQHQVERLKRFNSSKFLHWYYRLLRNREQLAHFLGLRGPNLIVDSPRASVEFPPIWRERILQIGREQLTRLKTRWDLPLEKFGYPLSDYSCDTSVGSIRKAA